jgi:selenocysteine-specific elongation factor
MLAGVGGIDAALLVVAADEGPMPQTAEHLAILDLLEVTHGVVALTKRDLVDDDWLELVIEEVRERLSDTVLREAPIIPVSSTTREGLPDLLDTLGTTLSELPERDSAGRPRLPVDRSFSVAGFGTVVTGTLVGGAFDVGQEVEVLPRGLRGRVRGLQSHGRKVERALPGARTALNLTGIDRPDIQRGDVVSVPGWLTPTDLLDVRLKLVSDAPHPLEQNDPVDLFIGAAEAAGFATLLDAERLAPGEEGWVQVRLGTPVVALAGDRYIVRQPSPSLTIGGGVVIDPHPRRHRRFRREVISSLETRATGTPEDRLLHALAAGPRELRDLAGMLDLDVAATRDLVASQIASGALTLLGPPAAGVVAPNRLLSLPATVERASNETVALLHDYHVRFPLRRGMPREEVRSRLALAARTFDALVGTLASSAVLCDLGSVLALPDHQIRLNAREQAATERFLSALKANPNSPPAPAEFGIEVDLLAALADLGLIVRLPDNVVYGAEQLRSIQQETLTVIDSEGSITLAQFRDHFGSSRKYAQAVLEFFDQQRITRRVGDVRVRGSG